MKNDITERFAPLTQAIKKFVQSFNEEYDVCMGTDFYVVTVTNTIVYTIAMSEKSGQAFYNNFVSRFPKCGQLSIFTLSLLHELGHLEMEWDEEDDIDLRNIITTDEEYFNLHNERIATDWAGEYATEHLDEMTKLDQQFINFITRTINKLLI